MTDPDRSRSPLAEPARYPGQRPDADYLLVGDRIRPLRVGPDGWRVGVADGPGEAELLDHLIGGPLTERLAVVAFGSNAAPAQLVAKFGAVPRGIPVTRARLSGFALAHSAHVSDPGYIPWVLVDEPGGAVDCAVLWLDRAQRARLDLTEPNYDLVPADPVRYRLRVAALDATIAYRVYRGRWGALRWPEERRPAAAGGQAAVFARLGRFGWFRELVGGGDLLARQRRLAGDAVLRHRVRDELAARGLVADDGWA